MSEPEEVLQQLRAHVDTLEIESGARIDRSHEIVIICGDDGKQIAFQGCCPKCGTETWVPAGRVTLAHLKDLGEATLDEIRKILSGERHD